MVRSNFTAHIFLSVCLIAVFACQSSPSSKEEAKQTENQPAVSAQNKLAAEPIKKFFQFKSVRIDFVYTGIFEGKDTYYIDDWGNTVVIVEDRKELGNQLKQTSIWKDEQTTIYNHLQKNVWRGKMRMKATEPPAVASIAESQLQTVGYKKMPDEQIAGKTCTVYDHSNFKIKYWLWKGIDLKIINRSVGTEGYVREAVNVVEDVAIPADLLAVPAGYVDQ